MHAGKKVGGCETQFCVQFFGINIDGPDNPSQSTKNQLFIIGVFFIHSKPFLVECFV